VKFPLKFEEPALLAHDLALYGGFTLFAAAIFGLVGTNTQAALARERLLADPDPLIARAGRLWRPRALLIRGTAKHRERQVVLQALMRDNSRWLRYKVLERELAAWNLLESAVALASGSALAGVVAVAISR
jgi:hypothetical protein